jgi:hypothetical protein
VSEFRKSGTLCKKDPLDSAEANTIFQQLVRFMSRAQQATNSVLSQLLEPVGRMMPVQFAKDLAALRAAPEVQVRIDELAAKCNEGQLTPDEKSEYEAYVDALDVISLLQAKARAVLAKQPKS